MEQSINKSEFLYRLLEMIERQHARMDSATTITQGAKEKADGHLEALYQVENLILNWGNENESLRQNV